MSYVLSGEQRPYDQKATYARRIKPDDTHGALELTARNGRVDLESENILNGVNTIYMSGLNWWATQYWKAGITYSLSELDRFGVKGITHSYQVRVQWIY
jgi:phosphate-selective porin